MKINNQKKAYLQKGKLLAGICLSATLAAAITGCGSSSNNSGTSGSSGSSSGGTIKIGEIGAMSGNLASLGTWDSQGLQMAVDEVNAKGGIHGKKVVIDKIDDQGNPSVAVNDANKLVNDKVVAAFATPESTTTLATLDIFNQAKIPQITSGQDPNITKKGSQFVFRDTASSQIFDKTLADYVVNKMGLKNIAVITNSGAFGKGEHDAFVSALKAHNITPVSDQIITPDAKDFSAQLTTIKAANPQVLFIGTEEIQMGLIAKQARALGINAKIVAGAGAATQIYVNTAGKSVADGTIFSTTYVTNDANAETKAFAAAYKKKFGQVADSHVAKAYDGAKMLLEAIDKAYPNIDGTHIRDELLKLNYHGLTGDFKFNAQGEGLDKTQMGSIKNGQPEPLQ
ncbi:ABC transporter substrate-binding protein [Fodinisporobacter ferrooxydans]|uniref:ABC transporter substrate-binding protein n=1 Tax=Fodinisporobacter ferrooxydans TaxID=2901836 RepID=A0ABY4CME2_9BACL|nr:ABC transporter substrate-binding protein [Alicyclobacillaceae bacterium MYW30-H2]